MVCIIDDREDVWNMATNLIQVKPYHFFQHTGDINAPPGMSKHELDGKGVDFGGKTLYDSFHSMFNVFNTCYFCRSDLKTKSTNTHKSNESAEVPSSSTETIASCSSKSDVPKEVKNPDSTTDEPKTNEKHTDSDIETDKEEIEIEETDKEETKTKDTEKEETETEDMDKEETVDKSDDETACGSSSQKPETEPNESDDQKDDLESSTSKVSTNEETSGTDDTLIDVEDPDDYLLYLESILMKIHSRFYTHYDETKQVFPNTSPLTQLIVISPPTFLFECRYLI